MRSAALGADHLKVVQAAQRAIKNKALSYLSALRDPKVTADLLDRSRSATNMTDQIAALACLVDSDGKC
jgi:aminopeptidase N